ncbi:hypothetical protein [uncultured Winogradskyella sp.]|uniref:hypothetical protein n=1 Tax=uncultured Winogradskyella sp. TaxID=395353 RepID=UPI0030DB51C9|tara:strand:+ start:144 stop:341 length:198 start_codon:yes stop_codon:yes gene_type:complete
MKKIIFYIAAIVSFFLIVNIIKIIATDFNRLTEYGFGYLVGQIILFVVFIVIALITRKSVFTPET